MGADAPVARFKATEGGYAFDWEAQVMKLLFRESVTLSLLFTSLALFLAATMPSVFHNVLVAAGLMHVLGFILVADASRLK